MTTGANSLDRLLTAHRVFILVGPYGTGKTEVAVNLALRLSALGRPTALADLDVVNPYFRSREREQVLMDAGVRLIAPPGHVSAADLPAVPPEVYTIIHNEQLAGVIDVGGQHQGATVLAQFAKALAAISPQVWYVLNRYRLGEDDVQAALRELALVEGHSGLAVTGLINNSHLLHETDNEVIRHGAAFAQSVAEAANLPLIAHTMRHDLAARSHLAPVLPMHLYNKRPWE